MSEKTEEERVASGPLGKVVGKIKQAAATITNDEQLAREGRLQEKRSDAELEARQRELDAEAKQRRSELEAEKLENDAERARLSIDIEEATRRQQADNEREKAADAERLASQIDGEGRPS